MKVRDKGRETAYAMIGAPVWAAKKIAGATGDIGDATKREWKVWVKEGEETTKRLRKGRTYEELSSRVDLDQIQEQVERLRDQLEGVLHNFRDSFRPERNGAAKKPAAPKAAVKTAPAAAKKTTTAAKKPAAKKTTAAKKPAAKKTTAAKKPAAS